MQRKVLLLALAVCLGVGTASAGTYYALDDDDNSIWAIDPITYNYTYVGSTGIADGNFGDMAFDSNTNTAYWVAGRGNNNLYTINLTTGAATLIGYHGVEDMFALGYDTKAGKLYGEDSFGNFYSLNTTTGAATLIGTNSVFPGGLTYRADKDQLVLSGAGDRSFYTMDRTNGAADYLGAVKYLDDNDVAYNPDKNVYMVDDWRGLLVELDADTLQGSAVNFLPGSFDGIIYVGEQNAVPEPGTLMLLGTGIVGLASRLRKK